VTGPRRSRPCFYGCETTARLYPGGWRCDEHAPPPAPAPPPGTTLAEIRVRYEQQKEVTTT
jgi:hypothetical protein